MGLAALLAAQSARADGPAAVATLDVTVTGVRSSKGNVRLAICPPNAGFPDCGARAVRTATLTIENGQARAQFTGLTPGTYAISVFHDANGNGKLDTFLGIPKDGYGFSRNPPFRPRAPRFDETVITVEGRTTATISLRYLM